MCVHSVPFCRYLGFNKVDNLITSSIETSLAENKRRRRRIKRKASDNWTQTVKIGLTAALGFVGVILVLLFKRQGEKQAAVSGAGSASGGSTGGHIMINGNMQTPVSRLDSGPEWTTGSMKTMETKKGIIEYHSLIPADLNRSEYSMENEAWKNVAGQLTAECPTFDLGKVKCIHDFTDASTTAGAKYRKYRVLKQDQGYTKEEMKQILVFHGTPKLESAFSIVQEGFRIGGQEGSGALFGQGVYSDIDPTEPLVYGKDKVVVMCRGLVGKQYRHHDPPEGERLNLDNSFHEEGFDSWLPTKKWRVFKTSEQLLPEYVIEFNEH